MYFCSITTTLHTHTHSRSRPYVGVVYSDRRALLSVGLPHPYGLALHGDFLYWTDWEARAVQRVNKTDPAHREVVIRNIDTPMDIQVFHRNRATLSKLL